MEARKIISHFHWFFKKNSYEDVLKALRHGLPRRSLTSPLPTLLPQSLPCPAPPAPRLAGRRGAPRLGPSRSLVGDRDGLWGGERRGARRRRRGAVSTPFIRYGGPGGGLMCTSLASQRRSAAAASRIGPQPASRRTESTRTASRSPQSATSGANQCVAVARQCSASQCPAVPWLGLAASGPPSGPPSGRCWP